MRCPQFSQKEMHGSQTGSGYFRPLKNTGQTKDWGNCRKMGNLPQKLVIASRFILNIYLISPEFNGGRTIPE
jgi:hypothetical protein